MRALHDRNSDLESDHIAVAIDAHTAFLHADVDQDLCAEPPEPDEWYDAGLKEDEVWKLNKALYGFRKAPKLCHHHLVSVAESLNYHPLLTDPSCFRNDETNTHIFIHVDDGLLFGPRSEVLKLVELLSKQVLMRIMGRMEKMGDKIYFLGREIERAARGYSVEANPKNIRNVISVLGLEEAKLVMTPSVKRTPTTESLIELEGERRAMYRTIVGKLLYMCQERADVMYSVKETAKKIYMSNQERRDEFEAYCEIPERRSACKEPDRNRYTAHRQRLGRPSNNVQKHKWRSCAVAKRNTHSMVTNTANSKLKFC